MKLDSHYSCVFMNGKSERGARGIHKKCRVHFPEFVKRTQDFTGDMVLIELERPVLACL